jgi:hypothetical protein
VVFSIVAVQLEAERTGLWYNVDTPACSSCPNIQPPLKILEECRGRIALSWIVWHPSRRTTPQHKEREVTRQINQLRVSNLIFVSRCWCPEMFIVDEREMTRNGNFKSSRLRGALVRL